MAKLNEALRSKLVFERREIAENIGGEMPGTQIIISTTHDGIYRQYSYINYPTDLNGMPQDAAQLEEEAKNILTWCIEKELNKRMTAKEKAIEIFNFYLDATDLNQTIAIACAISHVDALIKELVLLQINESHDAWVVNRVNFWDEVKIELEKL